MKTLVVFYSRKRKVSRKKLLRLLELAQEDVSKDNCGEKVKEFGERLMQAIQHSSLYVDVGPIAHLHDLSLQLSFNFETLVT